MAFANKEKGAGRKSAFKSFGNFIALHMVKRLVKRNKTNQVNDKSHDETDKDAVEAGFDSPTYSTKSNGVSRSNSLSTATYPNLAVSKTKGKVANGFVTGNNVAHPSDIPGVFGLSNHGNTCFMNSVTQCLSNTDLLAEYFVLGQYKQDLKNCRKDRSKKYGTKGEVIEQLAVVIRSLWMGLYTADMTKTLKDVIGKYAGQYKGSTQHDSQEFLLWLFDKMHEDLNMLPLKKKNFVRRQSFRKNRKAAAESNKTASDKPAPTTDLSPHSFIQKIFQGHYHSSLTCPTCKKKSETIDPFLCVSLPLKQRTTRPIYVSVVYLPNKRRSGSSKRTFAGRTIRIGVSVEIEGKMNHLRQAVAAECGIHSRLLAFVDLQHDGFRESYGDDKSISDIPLANSANTANSMSLYAFEIPPVAKMTAGTLPRNFASKQKKRSFGSIKQRKESTSNGSPNIDSVVIILINKQGLKEQGKRFGRPLVFRTSRDVLSSELQSLILNQMSEHLKNGIKHDRVGSLFRLQVVDGLPNKSYLSQQVQQPLRHATIDEALDNSPAGCPMHIKLVAEWDTDTKAGIFEKFPEEKVEVQESVRLQKVLHQQPVTCSLQECFDLYTEEEDLTPDDGWMCPHCSKLQHGTRKKLSLYTLPDIFVLHLKRFRVENGRRLKLSTRVDFPITGLDMSKHIHSGEPRSPSSHGKMPWSHSANHRPAIATHDDVMYDLYAVCNHYGNMNSGHYTACCCNPLDGRWYSYDDEQTECIGEDSLSAQSVYILFYQRRSSSVALSCGGASINSVMSEHWSLNLPQIRQRIEFNSQSHLNKHSVSVARGKGTFAASRNKGEKMAPPSDAPSDGAAIMQKNVNNNSMKIAAALKERVKGDAPPLDAGEDSEDGGFASPTRPYAKGLRRQGSAVVGRATRTDSGQMGGRQYRSYRHSRTARAQRSSHV